MTVSVVIPTRDRPALLAQAVGTALQQSAAVEVIVVDDASARGAAETLDALADDRLRTLRQRTPSGPAVARNRGIAQARGEWIAFLDDDDLWSPDKLALQLEVARAAEATFVYGHAVLFDERRHTVTADVTPPSPDKLPRAMIERNTMPAGSSNVLVRADLLERTSGFDERLSQLADWDMWLRLAAAGRAAVCPEVVVGCRRHAGNLLLTDRHDVRHEFAYLADKHRSLSREHDATFDPVAFSHWVAAGHLEAGRRRAAARTHLQAAVACRDLGHLASAIRVPLGERAMGLRQRGTPNISPPEWLRSQLRWCAVSWGSA